LKEDDDDIDGRNGASTPVNQSFTMTRLSLGGLSVTRAERSSLGGMASSSQQRALLGTLNNGSLRLVDGLCDVGQDGLLLMPGSQMAIPSLVVDHLARDDVERGRSLFGQEASAPGDLPLTDGDDLNDGNDGNGFALNDDGDDDIEPGESPVFEEDEGAIGLVSKAAQDITKRVTFAETAPIPKRADPWALLDPHLSAGINPRPLRKGKTYVLPVGIDLPPSQCVNGASTRKVVNRAKTMMETPPPRSVIIESLEATVGSRADFPRIPIDGLAFGDEFLYLAKQHAKAIASERRAARKRVVEEHFSTYSRSQTGYVDDDDDDDGNDGAAFDFGIGANDDDNDDYENMGNAGLSTLDEAFGGEKAGDGKFCRSIVLFFSIAQTQGFYFRHRISGWPNV